MGAAPSVDRSLRERKFRLAEPDAYIGLMTGRVISAIRRPMENTQPQLCGTCSPWWRLPLLLGVVLAAIVWSRSRSVRDAPTVPKLNQPAQVAAASSREKVSLVINYGNDRRKTFEAVAWRNGMTVADLLNNTPDIAVTRSGAGQSAFLSGIDGVTNEGTGGHNWTYSVNGKSADRSFAIYELQPGDQVLWTFGVQQ
jgi:uncharacterized protein DUF4430